MAVKVKVCGITNLADAENALETARICLGFNFYPPSPRCLAPEKAQEIIDAFAGRLVQRRAVRQRVQGESER